MSLQRVLIDRSPFAQPTQPGEPSQKQQVRWNELRLWPARWLSCEELHDPPTLTAFRCRFDCEQATELTLHLTADERYELYLDGRQIGWGPERGDRLHWFYETYAGRIPAGKHTLVVAVRALGKLAPVAQLSYRPGFILAAEGPLAEQINTHPDRWQYKTLGGISFHACPYVGPTESYNGEAMDWGYERGEGDGWSQPNDAGGAMEEDRWFNYDYDKPKLAPAMLPAMMDELRQVGSVRHVSALADEADPIAQPIDPAAHLADETDPWQALIEGEAKLTVPAETTRRVLIDLEQYYCGFPVLITDGGMNATIDVQWEEALYDSLPPAGDPWRAVPKGDRDAVDGKYFRDRGDRFRPDGERQRRFTTFWWRAGRYVQLIVRTAEHPLTIEQLAIRETRYPMEAAGGFECDDPRISNIVPIMWRAVQECAHETYQDCPYYEQLMYVGDTRLEALVTLAMSNDDRLPRKAIKLFGWSTTPEGLTASRYPAHSPQVISGFSLWWIGMVHDYAMWRGDRALIVEQMPMVRSVLERFAAYRNADGLVERPRGWNYMDWVPQASWEAGIPPAANDDVSAIINWQFAWLLQQAAELESWVDEPDLARRWRRMAEAVSQATDATFWDAKRGLYADDRNFEHYSEHAQCLAILSGLLEDDRRDAAAEGLFTADDLARTTIYFSHYLLETARQTGRIDRLFDRLSEWYDLAEQGFKTTRETPEPSRSDCHGWGGHPLYHLLASVAGIRPAGFGFEQVHMQPMLGPLRQASGRLIHRLGPIDFALRRTGEKISGRVSLPEALDGKVYLGDTVIDLSGGETTF